MFLFLSLFLKVHIRSPITYNNDLSQMPQPRILFFHRKNVKNTSLFLSGNGYTSKGYTVEPRYLELAYFELSSFPHYFIYIFLTSGVKLHIHLLNVIVQFIVFLTLSTLICRNTDISKCFSEPLGIRDNGSRL